MLKKNHTGFTLIELLTVVSIIGLMASIVLVSLGQVRAQARDTQRLSDMRTILTALELFSEKNGHYPGVADGLLNSTGAKFGGTDLADIALGVVLAPYLPSIPIDPLHDGIVYFYSYDPRHCTDDPFASCNCSGRTAMVLAFNKAETNSIKLQKQTCSGGDMNQNNADFNIISFPAPAP